ncbi:MAG: YraN family protein [Gammaproteobacteria bacterium]|nr:YraN family protein [Gammaproteobacteria bacterium]
MRSKAQQTGFQVEQKALNYLKEQGLLHVASNYRCNAGEIDIIMQDQSDETRIFVEVRFRQIGEYGDAAESVTRKKQSRIILAAKHYLQSEELFDKVFCRFDVVAISEGKEPHIEWLKDAFWVKF